MQCNENKFQLLPIWSKSGHKRLHLILWTKQQKNEQTQCVKDLGIKMNGNLSFTDHIE